MEQKKQSREPNKNGFITTAYRLDWRGSGNMVEIKHTTLDIGQRVFLNGAYNRDGWFVVCSEPENDRQKLVEIGGEHRTNYWECNHDDQSVKNIFGIGLYYDDSGERLTAEEIASHVRAADIQKRWNERAEKRKLEAQAKEREELREKYRGILTPIARADGEYEKTRKANLMAYLAYRFPGVKFTAKKDYSSYTIKWTDGPAETAVLAAANVFNDHTFNGYEDYNEYTPSEFTKLFGGFEYSHNCDRTISEKFQKQCEEEIFEKCPELRGKSDDFEAGREAFYKCDCKDVFSNYQLRNLKRLYVRNKSAEAPAKSVKSQSVNVADKRLEYVDYSEKAFAVIGDAKPIKDLLADLGGRFNARLKCGPGYIFSKKKETIVREKLSLS